MFIISVSGKIIKKRLAAALAAAAVFALIIAASNYFIDKAHSKREINGKTLDLTVRDGKDIIRIAEFFVPDEIITEPEKTEVTVPYEFNSIYEEYNEMQKEFGTDFYGICGKECEKYTVRFGDIYDGRTLTLLVYNGLLIGGDLSENAFDGEMKGLAELNSGEVL